MATSYPTSVVNTIKLSTLKQQILTFFNIIFGKCLLLVGYQLVKLAELYPMGPSCGPLKQMTMALSWQCPYIMALSI